MPSKKQKQAASDAASKKGGAGRSPTASRVAGRNKKDAAPRLMTLLVADLKPYKHNSRVHDDEHVAQIAASVSEFGFNSPVLVDDEMQIIAGHGRVLAAKQLGLTQVPCVVLSHLSEAQRRAYVIADNKIAINAKWDEDLLRQELSALQGTGLDLGLLGFSEAELQSLVGPDAPTTKGKVDDDEVPTTPVKPTSRPGDVYTLGRHKLLVGDATEQSAFQRLLGEQHADMVWTDPPYNVAYEGKAGRILNDSMSPEEFKQFLVTSLGNCLRVLKPGGCAYVSHADMERVSFTQAFVEAGFKLSQVLTWIKQSATLSRQDYNWQHEPILYGWREGAAHFFAGDFTQTTVIDQAVDVSKLKVEQARELLKQLVGALRTTVLRENRPTKSELHPTMKPVALVQRMIESSSRETEVVLDPFGDSGTTLIAAEKSNRVCYMLELDPKFADVIVNRWQNFTGKHAVLYGTKKTYGQVTTSRVRVAA